MGKKRVVLSGLFFPVAILRYFEKALQEHPDVDLTTVGVYTDSWIPWNGGMELPEKYARSPDIPLAKMMWNTRSMNPNFLFSNPDLQDIDLWIQCDAGFFFNERPPAKHVVHIATDPHVLDYKQQRGLSDKFFNMQDFYKSPGDIYLPYAGCKSFHYIPEAERIAWEERSFDVAIVGLNYPNRQRLADRLRVNGLSVKHLLGLGMDEYREAHRDARVCVSWSSLNDLIARVFEAGLFGMPLVTNRVPDLDKHFVPDKDMLVFDTMEGAIRDVERVLAGNHTLDVSGFSDKILERHLYRHRVDQILNEVFG